MSSFPKLPDIIRRFVVEGHFAMYRKEDGTACLVVPAGTACCPGPEQAQYYDVTEDGEFGKPYPERPDFKEVIRL